MKTHNCDSYIEKKFCKSRVCDGYTRKTCQISLLIFFFKIDSGFFIFQLCNCFFRFILVHSYTNINLKKHSLLLAASGAFVRNEERIDNECSLVLLKRIHQK